jgi:hypothetical protein
MGLSTAMGIAGTELSLEGQIGWHFATNCYPPIPKEMIPVATEAINAYWEEDYQKLIQLPEGVEFRDGSTKITAVQAIESLRLEAWCLDEEE